WFATRFECGRPIVLTRPHPTLVSDDLAVQVTVPVVIARPAARAGASSPRQAGLTYRLGRCAPPSSGRFAADRAQNGLYRLSSIEMPRSSVGPMLSTVCVIPSVQL